MIRLLSLPMIVTSGVNCMLGLFFLALHRRLKQRCDEAVSYYFVFSILALVSAVFLGAFATLLNASTDLALLDAANRITIIAAMFNILLAIHFYVVFFDYVPPVRLGWLYGVNAVFIVLTLVPSRFFLAKEFYRTSDYYIGLSFGAGFRAWGAWIVAMSLYAILILGLVYRRMRKGASRHSESSIVALILTTLVWLVTGISDDLTAMQLLDLPPLTWLGSCLITGCIAWILVLQIDTLYDERRRLNDQLMRDHLTGAYSRGLFDLRLAESIEWLQKGCLPGLCLCVFDVDNFKGINDGFGHAMGDRILKMVANTALQTVRATDCAARLGGDEFVILLPGVPRDTVAVSIIERIRSTIANCAICDADGQVKVSCSFGLVHAGPEHAQVPDLPIHLLKAADRALYAAKRQGKNLVSVQSLAPPTALGQRSSGKLRVRS